MSALNNSEQRNTKLFASCINRFKGMSWIDIVILVEEEEEIARANAIPQSIIERNALIAKGEYELEEGEEIESIE